DREDDCSPPERARQPEQEPGPVGPGVLHELLQRSGGLAHSVFGSLYSPNSCRSTSQISPSVHPACAAAMKRSSRLSLLRQASRIASSSRCARSASRFLRNVASRSCCSFSTAG